ncbi:MAG TPA: DMT family transporter [Casimicrobiaceae bacterium]|nr:DMT family transporter [Casimicrobiaceae bacterium]
MTARPQSHVPPQAVLLIVAALLCFTLIDAIIKLLTQRYPVPLLVFARWGVQVVALLLWLVPAMGTRLFRSRELPLQLARGVLLLGASLCFFNALKFLPLAEVTALTYLSPMLVALLSAVFLHERLTALRVAMIAAGLLGMLLIVRPGGEVFHGAALLALAAAGFNAAFQILTRKLAAEDARVTLVYPAIVGTVLMSFATPWTGIEQAIPWVDVALIVVAGLVGTFGHFLFILAFQRAPASGLTPFTYVQLVWATVVGWAIFGRLPDAFSLAGMLVIAGSGLVVVLHERRRSRLPVAVPTVID